jgi:hypothetical protein
MKQRMVLASGAGVLERLTGEMKASAQWYEKRNAAGSGCKNAAEALIGGSLGRCTGRTAKGIPLARQGRQGGATAKAGLLTNQKIGTADKAARPGIEVVKQLAAQFSAAAASGTGIAHADHPNHASEVLGIVYISTLARLPCYHEHGRIP